MKRKFMIVMVGNWQKMIALFLVVGQCTAFAQDVSRPMPTDQPDANGKIIKGRAGTHHWQDYMKHADLTDYVHAPDEAIDGFMDLKYGLRIHWGPYAMIHGRESWGIIENIRHDKSNLLSYQGLYHHLYKSWYPEKFNADEWMEMIQRNGLKFFTFTTKHHDGFSMFDTQTKVVNRKSYFGPHAGTIERCNLSYSIMETPFRRDVTKELVLSARAVGLKIGLYFSHIDWYDSDFRFDRWNPNGDAGFGPETHPVAWERFKTRHKEQIRELLSNYGPIDLLSFDMYFPEVAWEHMQDVARFARSLQPNCMLRWRGIGNYGDYHTPENYIPGEEHQGTMPWKVIHSLSTRDIFSYEPDERYIRSGDWIVSNLVDIVSKGGVFMVGAGPDLTGAWHPAVLESLSYAGEWLGVNGESIYETRPCVRYKVGEIYFTRSKNNEHVFAFRTGWPGESLFIPDVCIDKKSKVWLLGHQENLSWKVMEDGIVVKIPKALQAEENRPCKQIYVFKIEGSQR